MKFPNVVIVDYDFCNFGMKSSSLEGEGPVKKRTRTMTNSKYFAMRFVKAQCHGDNKHVPLVNFRAGPRQKYPKAFCDEACMVVKEELLNKNLDSSCLALTNLMMSMTKADEKILNPIPSGADEDALHPHDIGHHHLYIMAWNFTTMSTESILKRNVQSKRANWRWSSSTRCRFTVRLIGLWQSSLARK